MSSTNLARSQTPGDVRFAPRKELLAIISNQQQVIERQYQHLCAVQLNGAALVRKLRMQIVGCTTATQLLQKVLSDMDVASRSNVVRAESAENLLDTALLA